MRASLRNTEKAKTAMSMGEKEDKQCVIQGEEEDGEKMDEKFAFDDVYPCVINMCGSAGCMMVVSDFNAVCDVCFVTERKSIVCV